MKPNQPSYYGVDSGCEFSPSCLNCLLDVCVLDIPGGRRHWIKEQREKKILKLFNEGKTPKEVAVICGVSLTTIYRAARKGR